MKKLTIFAIIVMLVGTAGIVNAQKRPASDYNMRKAYEALEENNNAEALRYLDEQIEEFPHDADALLTRGMIYGQRQNNYAKALSDINLAIRYYKRNCFLSRWRYYNSRAYVYEQLGQNEFAMQDYATAYRYALKVSQEDAIKVLYNRADLYYAMDDYDRSDADYHQILKFNEAAQGAMIGLARNMLERHEYETALEMLNMCEKYDSKYEEIYRFRCQVYDEMGEIDKAIDDVFLYIEYIKYPDYPDEDLYMPIFKKHMSYALAKVNDRINKSDEPYSWRILRTMISELRGDYVQAIADYDWVEHEYGADPAILFYRAKCFNLLGDTERALDDMNRCIDMRGDIDYYGVRNRGIIYRDAHRYEEAVADFTCSIELEPLYASSYCIRGWCYELMGDTARAAADYSAAIDINKDYSNAYMLRGRLYFRSGDQDKAVADFEEVLRRDTLANSDSSRHYALHFLGRDDEAEAWMEKVVTADPYDNGRYYDKACLLALMGRPQEALGALRHAFELGYRNFAHIETDHDMDPVRELPEFKSLIDEYRPQLPHAEMKASDVDTDVSVVSEVSIKRQYGGTYEIACTVNDLPLQFIFDTGASKVTISSVEASFMLKNNYLKPEDIKGKEYFSTATGEIREGTMIRLREIRIGEATLRNVDASVVHNQQAPLLLGQSVLERFGTITIDNINSKLIIKQ